MLAYQKGLASLVADAEREGQKLIAEAERAFRNDSYTAAVAEVMRRLASAFDGIFGGRGADRIINRARNDASQFNRSDLARVLSIDIPEFEEGAIINTWTRQNVKLVKSIPSELHSQLDDMLRESAKRGSDVGVVTRRIQERFAVAKSRARLIARDQVLTLNAELTESRHTELGIREYEWSSSSDERVRGHHSMLDGRTFSWSTPPVGGGTSPGEIGHPGKAINCRCVAVPLIPD